MKKLFITAAALAVCARTALAGIGINWTMGGFLLDKDGTFQGLARSDEVTWQLIHAGPDGRADAVNPSDGDCLGGDDTLLAERVVPAGGGAAADGTSWGEYLGKTGGYSLYEDLQWSGAGSNVYQRVYKGSPAAGAWYYESGLFTFNTNYAGQGSLPDLFAPAAATGGFGVYADRQVPEPTPVVSSFLVRKLYEGNYCDATKYSTVELAVYSAAAANENMRGACLTYVIEGGGIDMGGDLDRNGEHLKLDGVYDIEQENHYRATFDDKGWAYIKADLQGDSAIRVTGEFGPYNPAYEQEAPNGRDRRRTLSTSGLLQGQTFYVIERAPCSYYVPTGYVYVGDDEAADPRDDATGMTQTGPLDTEITDETDHPTSEYDNNPDAYVPATVPAGALFLKGEATSDPTTVFVVNKLGISDQLDLMEVEMPECDAVYDGGGLDVPVDVFWTDEEGRHVPDAWTERYALGDSAEPPDDWSSVKPAFTNVCDTTLWVEVSIEGWFATTSAVVRIRPAPLGITARDQTFPHDGQPHGEDRATYTDPADIASKVVVSGLAAGDVLASVTLDGTRTDPGTGPIVPSDAVVTNATGDVTSNYDIGYTNGTLTVEVELRTIAASVLFNSGNGAVTYDGQGHAVDVAVSDPADDDPPVTVFFALGTSAHPTDIFSNTEPMFTNVCDVTVWVEISAEGYQTVTNSARVTITPAPLAVTAKDQTYVFNGRPQGEDGADYATPASIAEKVEVEGLAPGDVLASVTLDGTRTEAGMCPIVPSDAIVTNATGDVTSNYDIGYTNGTLTILEPPPRTAVSGIVWKDMYGGGNRYPAISVPEAKKLNVAVREESVRGVFRLDLSSLSDEYYFEFSLAYNGRKLKRSDIRFVQEATVLHFNEYDNIVFNSGSYNGRPTQYYLDVRSGRPFTMSSGRPSANVDFQPTYDPVAGVVVEILAGDDVAASDTTAADGSYLVTNLLTGAYTVRFTMPEGYDSASHGPESMVAAAENVTKAEAQITLTTAAPAAVVDAGLYRATTSALVWLYWEDEDDLYGARPTSVTLRFADGDLFATNIVVVCPRDSYYPAEVTGLPKYAGGETLEYTVSEPDVPARYEAYAWAGNEPMNFTINHTYVTSEIGIVVTGCTNVYDGIAHTIGVTTNGAIAGLALKYCAVDGGALGESALPGWNSAKPEFTNVTNVTVYVEASAPGYITTTNSTAVTITKRPVTFAGTSETRAYTGSAITITNVVADGLVAGHAHNVAFSATGTEVGGPYAGTITAAGDVSITDAGGADRTGNYDIAVANGALTIERDPDLAFEVLLEGATFPYDGEAHALTNAAASTVRSGETAFEYARDGGAWTNELSALTATNVADSCAILVRATNPNYANPATNSAALAITPRDVALAHVEDIPTQFYEGDPLTPAPSVTDGDPPIITAEDYSVFWSSNAVPGTGYAILTGRRNYGGTNAVPFTIVLANRELRVAAGRWGHAEAVVGGERNLIAGGTATNLPVAYGTEVAVTAVPDAGFAVAGEGSFACDSFTNAAEAAFAFRPDPVDATLRWKFSSAVGRYFAQIAIPARAGYAEALDGLAFLFADRTNAAGEVYAQLWDAAARAPQGVLVTDGGAAYRGVALNEGDFAGRADGTRVLWGVSDGTLADATRNVVPAGERRIGLYVRKRVSPVSGNETAGEVENFLGYLTWKTDDTRYFLPIVENAANGAVTTHSSLVTRHSSLVSRRAYAPATLGLSATLGLGAEAVSAEAPTARIAAFAVAADGSVSGRVEAVAGGEASSSFGPAATVRILSAPSPAGPWAEEASAAVDPATGEFALPAGALSPEGRFFKTLIETTEVLE